MDIVHHLVGLVAGISFFMYGMMLASENLQILAADNVRAIMGQIASRPFLAVLGGIGLTVLLQSSSASTVLLVNLASAGVVNLIQVMGVIMGATVGTTVTVQLISFRVIEYALYVIIVGSGIIFFSKNNKTRNLGKVVFGFGLIFYGLFLMGESISFIKDVQGFRDFFVFLNQNPFVAFAFATIFTAVVHSSAVTVGLAMTLASHGVISIYDSMFWVYGANLGTTATALNASFSGNYVGRQVAWAHFFYKAASCLLFVFFTAPFASFMVRHGGGDTSHIVANAHTFFNIASAIIFYPFITVGAKLIEKIFPRPQSEKEFGPKYLDRKAFANPPVAFANAVRETQRMAEYALELVRMSLRAFEKDDPDFRDDMKVMDTKIDVLNREIKLYLVRLTDEPLGDVQNARVVNLIALVSDIENIGDVIDKNVLELARKKSNLKLSFSDEGWQDVQEFHKLVVDNFSMALSAFSLSNLELAKMVVENKQKIRILEVKLREAHIHRLHRKMQDSLNTSNIHMDLLSAYRRVNSYVCNLVYPVLNTEEGGRFPSRGDPG
jgi:phosphate:Na+ symporter